MKIWIYRGLILLLLIALAPMAEWLQWLLDTSFGDGDGVITKFYINYVIAALPMLGGFLIVGMGLWWLRLPLSSRPVMLVVCALIVTFGILNFSAEIFLSSRPKPIGDDKDHRASFPYIEFKGSSESGLHNSLGYGGRVPAIRKEKDEYRIIVLGGSTVRFGSPPIPELVEMRFHDDGYEEVQVFNFGVSGSNTSMELARLVFEVVEYQPDLVISYSGGNDIHLPLVADPRPGYPFNYMIRENHPLLDEDFPLSALIAHGSYLARIFGHRYFGEKFSRVSKLQREVRWKTAPWRAQLAAVYADNIQASARIAGAFGSDFVAFLQPSLLSRRNPANEDRAQLAKFTASTEKALGISLADWEQQNQTIRAEIRSRLLSGAQQNIRFVDMTAALDGMVTKTYADLIHVEPQSNVLLAEQIYQVVREIRDKQAH